VTDPQTVIDPARTALLVMDMQPAILDRFEDADALLDRASQAISTVRSHGGHIGYVRVAFEDEELAAIPAHSRMAAAAAAGGGAFHVGSPSSAVHDRLAPQDGDIAVRKIRVGAFSTTDLHDQLHGREIDTLILAGLSTSGVVLTTVREAHDRDFRVFVLADVTADPQPGVHEFLTERIFPRQGEVITLADLDTVLGG
jgi:nicotinamidase-related amidase